MATARELRRMAGWCGGPTPCLARRLVGAVRALALCSGSTPMGRVLRNGIASLATMGPLRTPGWLYRATHCMGRRLQAAVRAVAQCSLSIPMGRVLPTCIVSLAATDLIRLDCL